jgi:hypothetical protein
MCVPYEKLVKELLTLLGVPNIEVYNFSFLVTSHPPKVFPSQDPPSSLLPTHQAVLAASKTPLPTALLQATKLPSSKTCPRTPARE